jgi:hypothetical protein
MNKEDITTGLRVKNINYFRGDVRDTRLDLLSAKKEYVRYDSVDNLLPQALLTLYRNSPTHQAIIDKKTRYTTGVELTYDSMPLKIWAQRQDFGEGLFSLFQKLTKDLHLYGGFCVQVQLSPATGQVQDVHYQDFSKVRRGFTQDKEKGLYSQEVFISNDWYVAETARDEYTKIYKRPYYSFDVPCESEQYSTPHYYYFKQYTAGQDWYPLPAYYAATSAIRTEIELLNFKENSVKRGFTALGALHVNSTMSAKDQERFERDITNSTGSDSAGNIMTVFSSLPDSSIEFIPFNGNNPAKRDVQAYLDQARQDIITAHQLSSPAIVGIPVPNGLSNDGELIRSANQEFFFQLKQQRKQILKVLTRFAEAAGYSGNIEVVDNNPFLEQQPNSKMSKFLNKFKL